MSHGHFLWTDLSTYDLRAAKADYSKLFGWTYHSDGTYQFALRENQTVAGLFTMPERLAKIEMPSFWMSYIHVEDLNGSVERARSHEGVIIEVEPQAFNEQSQIALVRDPSGAGFTLYQGPELAPPTQGAGTVVARYHHAPDIGLIEEFYSDLFGWTFKPVGSDPWPVYDIIHPDGSVVARAEEVPEAIRGKFRYWMPCFSVDPTFFSKLEAVDGGVHSRLTSSRSLVADRQGAHFLVQTGSDDLGAQKHTSGHKGRPNTGPAKPSFAWKAALGLLCIWLAVALDLQTFWGVLFLIWTWPAIRSGRADFIEPVYRTHQPILYWTLIATWVGLSAWLIAADFYPGAAGG